MNTLYKISLMAGAALALSACNSASPAASGPSLDPAPAPAVTAFSTASPAASPAESVAPAPSPSMPTSAPPGPKTGPVDPCPVSERTLIKALKDTEIGREEGNPTKLIKIKCYRGYAVAQNGAPLPDRDPGWVLFGFKRPQNVWVPLSAGSADFCNGYVLDASTRDRLDC